MKKALLGVCSKSIRGIIILFVSAVSCGQRVKLTPQEYKYKIEITPKNYSDDSTYIYYVLETMLARHMSPFKPGSYYTTSSRIYVDSILYSPDKLRLIIFLISKVVNGKKEHLVQDTLAYDYNANYLFCNRDSITGNIKVYDYSAFNLGNFDSYKDVKAALMELCFGRRATDKWSEKQPRYNMDDIRFWNSAEFDNIISSNEFIQIQK